jgi:hypothetical protein
MIQVLTSEETLQRLEEFAKRIPCPDGTAIQVLIEVYAIGNREGILAAHKVFEESLDRIARHNG